MKKSNGALAALAAEAINICISPELAGDLIADCEKRITSLKLRLEELDKPRQEAFEKYEKLQATWDHVNHKHTQEEQLIDQLSRIKNGLGKTKPIARLTTRAESHNDMKEREKKKYSDTGVTQFTWTAYAAEVLKEQNKMMLPDDLWDKIGEKFDIPARMEAMGKTGVKSNIKWGAINTCWAGNIKMVMEGSRFAESRGKLFQHDDYIGLKEWAQEDWLPKPEYRVRKLQRAV